MKKILIVKLSSFGDLMHTLPAVSYLRGLLPDAQIDWVADKSFENVLSGVEELDNVIPIELRQTGFRPFKLIRLFKNIKTRLRATNYDLAIDFQGLVKSGLVTWLSGATVRAGFSRATAREDFASVFYNHEFHIAEMGHNIILKNLLIAQSVAVNVLGLNLEEDVTRKYRETYPLPTFKKSKKTAVNILKKSGLKAGEKYIIFHTGASTSAKVPSPEKAAAICDLISGETGLEIVLIGRGADLAFAEEIRSLCESSKPVITETDFEELRELIRGSEIYIGGDSGPLHFAGVLGARTVALFGPTDYRRNAPYGRGHVAVSGDVECRKTSCWKRCRNIKCMDLIEPESVLAAVKRLLN